MTHVPDPQAHEPALTDGTRDGVPVVELRGDWDISVAPRLKQRLDAFTSGYVTVDLSRTTFVDSTIIGTLIDLQRRLSRSGGGASLRLPEHGIIRRVFEMMSLEQYFGT
jgi:anti-anti-sigma factor